MKKNAVAEQHFFIGFMILFRALSCVQKSLKSKE